MFIFYLPPALAQYALKPIIIYYYTIYNLIFIKNLPTIVLNSFKNVQNMSKYGGFINVTNKNYPILAKNNYNLLSVVYRPLELDTILKIV